MNPASVQDWLFDVIVSAIFVGNVMTFSVIWAMGQFRRKDEKAPGLAYAAFLLPLALFVSFLVTSQGWPGRPGAEPSQAALASSR